MVSVSRKNATLVFDDPLMAHLPDPNSNEERWHTIGVIGGVVVIVATHGLRRKAGAGVGRAASKKRRTGKTHEEGDF